MAPGERGPPYIVYDTARRRASKAERPACRWLAVRGTLSHSAEKRQSSWQVKLAPKTTLPTTCKKSPQLSLQHSASSSHTSPSDLQSGSVQAVVAPPSAASDSSRTVRSIRREIRITHLPTRESIAAKRSSGLRHVSSTSQARGVNAARRPKGMRIPRLALGQRARREPGACALSIRSLRSVLSFPFDQGLALLLWAQSAGAVNKRIPRNAPSNRAAV
jgi:hypothetical protein